MTFTTIRQFNTVSRFIIELKSFYRKWKEHNISASITDIP